MLSNFYLEYTKQFKYFPHRVALHKNSPHIIPVGQDGGWKYSNQFQEDFEAFFFLSFLRRIAHSATAIRDPMIAPKTAPNMQGSGQRCKNNWKKQIFVQKVIFQII